MWWFAVMAVCFGWVFWSQVSLQAFLPDEARQDSPPPAAESALAAVPPQTPPQAALAAAPPEPIPEPPPAEPARFITPPAVQVAPERLAEAIQTELKRLGCYGGSVDNLWGRGSRYAMRKFVRAANLQFGSAEPDARAVVALRGYGNSGDCSAKFARPPAGAQEARISQTAPGNPSGIVEVADDRSYLPPWVRNDPRPVETAASVSHAAQPAKRHRRHYQIREVRFKPLRIVKVKALPAASVRVAKIKPAWTAANKPVREAVKQSKGRKKAVAGVVIRKFTATLPGWPGN